MSDWTILIETHSSIPSARAARRGGQSDGNKVYVANNGVNTVSVIDTATNTGPGLPTLVAAQVGSFLGHIGHRANLDPAAAPTLRGPSSTRCFSRASSMETVN